MSQHTIADALRMMNTFNALKPVRWDLTSFGVMPEAYDTGRRKWFGLSALIFYFDMDGKWSSAWVHTSSLIDGHFK